jgi:hypothetical protein
MATLLWNPYASYSTYSTDPNQVNTVAPLTGYDIPTIGRMQKPQAQDGTNTIAPLTGYDIAPIGTMQKPLDSRFPQASTPIAPLSGYNIPPVSQTMGDLQPPSIGSAPPSLGNLVSPDSFRGRAAQRRNDMRDGYGSMTDAQKFEFGTEAVVGGVNLAVDAGSIASQKLGLGKPSTMFYEEGVNPVYRTGEYYNRAFYARPMGATGAEVANTGLKAAATGSKLGMMVGGPAGAAIGAAAGAVVGAGTALVAGGVRKRRQQREKNRALNLARGQQADYNRRSLDFSQQQTAMNEYRRRNDPYERMSNFYTA